jgi:hypothetical protein
VTATNETGDVQSADADRPERVDRRAAMKAALAGAAAAAVWSAPRIEGLSIAPDVAQAASCTSPSADTTNHPATTSLTLVEQCWGVLNAGAISCSDFTQNRNALKFNIGVRIGGDDGGDLFNGGGFVKVTINGIDPPFQRCTVNVQANCFIGLIGGLNAEGSPDRFVINNNGTFPTANANQFSCNITGWLPERTIVNVACECL